MVERNGAPIEWYRAWIKFQFLFELLVICSESFPLSHRLLLFLLSLKFELLINVVFAWTFFSLLYLQSNDSTDDDDDNLIKAKGKKSFLEAGIHFFLYC